VKLDLFPELNLERDKTVNYYYKKLMELYEKNTSPQPSPLEEREQKNKSWENLKKFLN
jgi:hypothetical protein